MRKINNNIININIYNNKNNNQMLINQLML